MLDNRDLWHIDDIIKAKEAFHAYVNVSHGTLDTIHALQPLV